MTYKLKGTFIGKDGTMGFEKGKTYKIKTYVTSQFLRKDGYLWVEDKVSGLKCPYSRLETLLANWDITIIDK